ncbi:MAG: hypothetical protein AAF564_18355 [Bacteroidota bacterium]
MLKSSITVLMLSHVLAMPAQAQYSDLLLSAGLAKGEAATYPSIYSFRPSNPYWSVSLLHGFSAQPKVGFRYGVRFFQVSGSEASSDYVFVGDLRFENKARFKHFYLGIPFYAQFGNASMAFFFGPEFNVRLSSNRSRDIPVEPDTMLPRLPGDRFSRLNVLAVVGARIGIKLGARSYFVQLRYSNATSIYGLAGVYEETIGLSIGTRFKL